jgi:thiamine-monophosphate kinase
MPCWTAWHGGCGPASWGKETVTGQRLPGEFELIARFFAPLAGADGVALGLVDDAAVIRPTSGTEMVATVDTLVAGVHFLADDPPDLVARKLLRVSLSDLAAMGATPRFYLLAMALPGGIDVAWLESFAAGLAADQAEFGVSLAGGDTTATTGPVTLSLTALGEVPAGAAIRRSAAGQGDDIYVSGTIGDAALAVALMGGGPGPAGTAEQEHLRDRYRLPRPRVALGAALRGVATAAIDVSDGLVADLGHVCETSAVGAGIDASRVPLSPAARDVLAVRPALMETVLTGGDDYELLFTADPSRAGAVAEAAERGGVAVQRIGRIVAGSGVRVVDAGGGEITLKTSGYHHF